MSWVLLHQLTVKAAPTDMPMGQPDKENQLRLLKLIITAEFPVERLSGWAQNQCKGSVTGHAHCLRGKVSREVRTSVCVLEIVGM